jgi:hypothetical protein
MNKGPRMSAEPAHVVINALRGSSFHAVPESCPWNTAAGAEMLFYEFSLKIAASKCSSP